MFNVSDITMEYVSPHLKIYGSFIRIDDEDSWYGV